MNRVRSAVIFVLREVIVRNLRDCGLEGCWLVDDGSKWVFVEVVVGMEFVKNGERD